MEKLKKEFNELLEFIKAHKTSFILTIFFTFIVYGIKLFNYSLSIDSEVINNNYYSEVIFWYMLGRFSLGFIKFLLGLNPFNYYLSNILMIIFFSISSFLLYYIINSVKKNNNNKFENLKIFLFTSLIISSPVLAEQFNFTLQCAEVAISLFILDIGLYLFIKGIQSNNNFLLFGSVICFVENIGCYQALLPIIVAVIVEFLIILNKDSEYTLKQNVSYIIKTILVGIFSLIGYYIVNKIVIKAFGLSSTNYLKDQILWLSHPIKENLINIYSYIKQVILSEYVFYNKLYLASILLTFVMIIKNYKKFFLNLLNLFLLITPFLLAILLGSGMVVRMQMLLPILVAIILIFNIDFKNKYINYIIGFVIIFFIFGQMRTTLNLFESDYARYSQDKALAENLINQISPLITDESATKLVFIGQRAQSGPSMHVTGETFGISFFCWDFTSPYGISNRAIGFINTLGHKFSSISPEDFELGKKISNEQDLEIFPKNNSIYKYNNYIIIKLSD